MSRRFPPDQIPRIQDDARRLAERAADHRDHLEALAALAAEDIRRAEADLAEVPNRPDGAVAYLREALQSQVQRSVTSVSAARRLCIAAREQHLAACRLASDLDQGPAESRWTDLRPRRNAVLVADDYADTREVVCTVLQDAGFFVRTATNGLEAVIAAYEMCPAVIIMDITMPVLDGVEATRLIKATETMRDARVIAYTSAPPSLYENVMGRLFAAVLEKPAPIDVVVATVQQLASA